MGILWAHTGAIGCVVINLPRKFPFVYGETSNFWTLQVLWLD